MHALLLPNPRLSVVSRAKARLKIDPTLFVTKSAGFYLVLIPRYGLRSRLAHRSTESRVAMSMCDGVRSAYL